MNPTMRDAQKIRNDIMEQLGAYTTNTPGKPRRVAASVSTSSDMAKVLELIAAMREELTAMRQAQHEALVYCLDAVQVIEERYQSIADQFEFVETLH